MLTVRKTNGLNYPLIDLIDVKLVRILAARYWQILAILRIIACGVRR